MTTSKAQVEAQLSALQAEHEALKRAVIAKAMEIKNDQRYCNDVDRFLAEVPGLKPKGEKVSIVVEIEDYEKFLTMMGAGTRDRGLSPAANIAEYLDTGHSGSDGVTVTEVREVEYDD